MSKNMMFAGCDTVKLAEKYGTPLYVMSEDYINERCDEIKRDFLDKYPNTRAVFAAKAFLTLEMARIITRNGLGMDSVSGAEIYTELKGGADPANIIFHGNAKTRDEMEFAISSGVGRIVVDNESELVILNDVAKSLGKVQPIQIRVTPGVDSHTHKYISTAQEDSKFGVSIDQFMGTTLKLALELENLDFKGIHFHVGSQLLENDSHIMATEVFLKLMKRIRDEFGIEVEDLNLGGGFGVHYEGDPERQPVSYFMEPVMEMIDKFCSDNDYKRPTVIIEPGRFICAEAGITLYTVSSAYVNGAGRKYIGVDGGMPDNPRTALYEARYEVECCNRQDEEKTEKLTVAGKCCESGDILVWDAPLPEVKVGDTVAVLCTGAYNYTMSSNYNRVPRPAVVMLKDGEDRLSVKRETYEDLLRNEL